MQLAKITNFIRGWFVGDFNPTVYRTNKFEAAAKSYKAGDKETPHYHKVATEITFVAKGKISMNGKVFKEGDIIVVNPNEVIAFEAVEDSVNFVIKVPCVKGDKYEAN